LLCTVIYKEANVCMPPNYCESNAGRVTRLKEKTDGVKIIDGSFNNMVQTVVQAQEEPRVIIRKALEIFYECDEAEFYIINIILMSAFVIDVCIDILVKKREINVCEIIENAVDFMFEKGLGSCMHYLWYLDNIITVNDD
ncbi:hypothetical protein, partial [Aeromonas sobria]|uniref:hypothetical protein n=1 Tax=Aeromonas sobria TaxID=646 RepID=UPI003F35BE82